MSFFDRARLKAVEWIGRSLGAGVFPHYGPRPHEHPYTDVFFSDWPGQRCIIPLDASAFDFSSSSLVMAPVNYLARALSQPTPTVEEREGDNWEAVEMHPMLDLLARPNRYYAGERMLWSFSYSWVTTGNVFWFKTRDARGQVVELWPLDSTAISAKYSEDGTEYLAYYEYTVNGTPHRIEPDDVVHFRHGTDPSDNRMGLSPMRACMNELYADREASLYSASIMKNGGGVPFAVSPKESPHPKGLDAAKLKAEIVAAMQGPGFQPLVINRPVDFHDFVFNPEQVGAAQAHRLPEERVAAVLGIPAVVLGFGAGLDRATYSNFEQARRIAWEDCIVPTLNYIGSELREQLLPEFETNNKNFWCGWDYTDVPGLREDLTALYSREVLAYDKGVKKRSEARTDLGLQSGPEDDIYKAAPAGGFGFGGFHAPDFKQGALWDDEEIVHYFRELAPDKYHGLITAREAK
jgi:HK97 family phage portal protein